MIAPASLHKINRILLFTVLLTLILYYGREILVMLVFSVFLAMLMTPVSNKFEKIGISRVFSTLFSVLIILIIILAVILLITVQLIVLSENIPHIQARLEEMITGMQSWIERQFSISSEQQATAFKEQARNVLSSAGGFLTGIVIGIVMLVGSFVLVLVFTFLFLLHRNKYENFFILLYKDERRNEAKQVIDKVGKVAQQYLVGRVISVVILTVFYTIGLLIVGIENAFLLSAIAAIVTFIPYVGPILGGLLPVFMAFVSEESLAPVLGVIVVISLAQAFDNYFVEPVVVGGNVNISPFFTIFILIVGGILWGIAGVILFLPLLGMVKIIFDNVEGLAPYAYLIGDQKDTKHSGNFWSRITKMVKKKE